MTATDATNTYNADADGFHKMEDWVHAKHGGSPASFRRPDPPAVFF